MKTIVGITENLSSINLSHLDSFSLLYNKVSHKLYVDLFIKKLQIKDLSPLYQDIYSINKRHFDSIRKSLEGKVSSILSLNKNYILDTKHKIKSIEKDLTSQSKTFNSYKLKFKQDNNLSLIETHLKKKLHTKLQYNHIRLSRLKSKLTKLQLIKETGNVCLCFGSKKLFRQQFNIGLNQNPFKSHEAWYKAWLYNRNKEFTLIGSKDESAANVNAQITHVKDNLFKIQLNINPHADKKTDKYVNIHFKVDYELETLKQIIKNNNSKNKDLWQPLTYKLIKQPSKSHNKDKYVVSISFNKHLIKHIYTSKDNGVLGVDINQDHLAVVNLDNKGNLLNIYTYEYDLNGSKHQNNNSISLAVKDLINLSVKLNKPIVIEQLDFTQKKKELSLIKNQSEYSKNKNKQLSSFAYSKIIELIKARAEDNFIEVREVNPAYTSIIGSIKYSVRSRVSVHHSAAICIGRKGIFNNPLNKEYKEKRISHRNRQVKTMDLPVRNNLKSVVYWKELKENIIKSNQHKKKCSSNVAQYSTSLRNNNMNMPIMPVMNVNVVTLS